MKLYIILSYMFFNVLFDAMCETGKFIGNSFRIVLVLRISPYNRPILVNILTAQIFPNAKLSDIHSAHQEVNYATKVVTHVFLFFSVSRTSLAKNVELCHVTCTR